MEDKGKSRLEVLSELIQIMGSITDGAKYYGQEVKKVTEDIPTETYKEAAISQKVNRLEDIMEKEITEIKEGMGKVYATLTTLQKTIDEIHLIHGSLNTRINSLEKKNFEILPKTKEPSVRSKAQTGIKRGTYKKRKKKPILKPIEPTVSDLGIRTIKKFSKKIESSLNGSKNFKREELLEAVKDRHPDLSTLSGRDMIYEIRKARWRLDGRRRRDLKLGMYANKDYWKKKQ